MLIILLRGPNEKVEIVIGKGEIFKAIGKFHFALENKTVDRELRYAF